MLCLRAFSKLKLHNINNCTNLKKFWLIGSGLQFQELHTLDLEKTLVSQYQAHSCIIQEIINKNNQITSNFDYWLNFIETCRNFGFEEPDTFKIISLEPQVLNIQKGELSAVLQRWHQCQLGDNFVKLLLLNNPSFLFVPVPFIEKRIPLLQVFAKKPKLLVLLLLRCPNVMTEQWEQIQAKLDYLTNELRVENSEILNSAALGKLLSHIKLRHNLLLKCGLYETPSQYVHKRIKNEKSAFRNPPLKRIVDNEDISFARKICKISYEEYEAFKELFEEEMETENEELFSDSDSDSE